MRELDNYLRIRRLESRIEPSGLTVEIDMFDVTLDWDSAMPSCEIPSGTGKLPNTP